MKHRKRPGPCLSTVIIALATWQMTLSFAPAIWAGENTKTKPEARANAVRALVSHLGLGEGSVIADIGAGDLNWIKHIDLGDIDYQAFDLVPRHPEVRSFDLLKKVPPKVDLIICFWVLNHMPKAHCKKAIENLKKSGAKYLMMTDVERYHKDQPKEIKMDYIECLNNGELLGTIKLIKL